MNAIDRFLRYVTYDTQSDEGSDTCPSTAKQKVLGQALADDTAMCTPGCPPRRGARASPASGWWPTWTPPPTRRAPM